MCGFGQGYYKKPLDEAIVGRPKPVKEPDICIRRVPGTCCPEPSCDNGKVAYCLMCGKLCSTCIIRPPYSAEELYKLKMVGK